MAELFKSVSIQDYMQDAPVQVSGEADLFEAIALILDNRVSGLCVVNERGELTGVLSELDCLNAILSAMYEGRTNVGRVRDYMTAEVVVSTLDDDIVAVAADMLKSRHRRRPVVRDGKLVGQISCRQLLRAVRDFSARD